MIKIRIMDIITIIIWSRQSSSITRPSLSKVSYCDGVDIHDYDQDDDDDDDDIDDDYRALLAKYFLWVERPGNLRGNDQQGCQEDKTIFDNKQKKKAKNIEYLTNKVAMKTKL